MSDTHDRDGVERITGYSMLSADSGELRISFGLEKAQVFESSHVPMLSQPREVLDVIRRAAAAVAVARV